MDRKCNASPQGPGAHMCTHTHKHAALTRTPHLQRHANMHTCTFLHPRGHMHTQASCSHPYPQDDGSPAPSSGCIAALQLALSKGPWRWPCRWDRAGGEVASSTWSGAELQLYFTPVGPEEEQTPS